jgi:hypothetical protein
VKGTSDGVEVIDNVKFTSLRRRDLGSLDGTTAFEADPHPQMTGLNLRYDLHPRVDESGRESTGGSEPVHVFLDGTIPESIPGKGSVESFNFSGLPPGPHTLTLWSGIDMLPRQIPLHIEPGKRFELPSIPIYSVGEVEIESISKNSLLRDHGFANLQIDKQVLITPEDRRSARFINGMRHAAGLPGARGGGSSGGSVHFEATQNGNIVALIPLVSGANDEWSVLRLGKRELTEYQNIDVQIEMSGPNRPVLRSQSRVPLYLTRGSCFLLRNDKAGYAVLVRVK